MSNGESLWKEEYLCRLLNTVGAKLHFSGVRGVSMSALAEFLAAGGHRVSGSDREKGRTITGVVIAEDPSEYIKSADALIYSLAIDEDDSDRALARLYGIPEYSRPELLGTLMREYKNKIGISGTHGKSTTTAMAAHLFSEAGLAPTVFSGAELVTGQSYFVGGEDFFIYEACEYKKAFLHFSPDCAIITGVEHDHTDCYPDLAEMTGAFIESQKGAGRVILSADFETSAAILSAVGDRALTFGSSPSADFCYKVTSVDSRGSDFELIYRGNSIGSFRVGMMGRHNVANATAAIALSMEYGIQTEVIRRALSEFHGIGRRLEHIGSVSGREVYYDYAHHPTELRSAISTLRHIYGKVSVIFRPHTYTRTRDLWRGFIEALADADYAVISEIFGARERMIPGVSSRRLAAEISHAVALDGADAVNYILSHTEGAILLMGAGDLSAVKKIIEDLIEQERNHEG